MGLNHYTYSYNDTSSDVNYDIDLKLQSVALLGNYFPFHGVFRLSAGIFSNGNKLNMVAQPTAGGTFDFNGTTYNSTDAGTVSGKVSFNSFAPYFGIGWGKNVR